MADVVPEVQVKSISSSGILSGSMTITMPAASGTTTAVKELRSASMHALAVPASGAAAGREDLSDNSYSSIQFISDNGHGFPNMDENSFESISTSAILRYCKMKVLKPYFRLLSILGWRPLISQATLFENAYWARVINGTYAFLILSLILTGYVLQYSSCYRQDGYRPYADPVLPEVRGSGQSGAPDLRHACNGSLKNSISNNWMEDIRDLVQHWRGKDHDKDKDQDGGADVLSSAGNEYHPLNASLEPVSRRRKNESKSIPEAESEATVSPFGFNAVPHDFHCEPKCRGNFFALYLVPNALHFLAYLSVLYLMRTPESEKLENLMERGFLQTTRTTGWMTAHKKLVTSLRSILWMCLAWLLLSLLIHGLIVGSRFQDLNLTWLKFGEPIKTLLIVLTLCALTFNDLICGAIVTSYTVHAQLNISYIHNLCASMREKRIDFLEFYKRIEEANKFLDYLNNEQALGLSLLLITIGCKLSVGVYALLASGEFAHWSPYAIAIVLLSILFWASLFAVPIVQAIRLTAACGDLKRIGHEIRARPFGYQDTPQSDLDSLLLFTTNLSMTARILRVPVQSPCILTILILFLIVVLMFGQLGLLNV